MASALLNEDDRKLLNETRRLLDDLLETIDVLSNPREARGIRQALKEVKEGKVRSWAAFEKEITGRRRI